VIQKSRVRTERPEAPAWQGARRRRSSATATTSNDATRDAAGLECNGISESQH
jgi:hypothetical protein